jgi:hypothetical protein
MPSIQTVESFVRLIEEGKTLESMQRYYAENASVRENMAAPRQGKPALIRHEENALAAVKSMKATCLRPILIAENVVVLRWIFEIENLQNKRVRLEELAYQQWSGEHIVEEQFFYDPAQLKMPL